MIFLKRFKHYIADCNNIHKELSYTPKAILQVNKIFLYHYRYSDAEFNYYNKRNSISIERANGKLKCNFIILKDHFKIQSIFSIMFTINNDKVTVEYIKYKMINTIFIMHRNSSRRFYKFRHKNNCLSYVLDGDRQVKYDKLLNE